MRSIERFAADVNAVAKAAPAAARFGDNKVFISHVAAAFRMSVAEFKARLVEAQIAGLVNLSRADLVEAMDPAMVAASRVDRQFATFHFVRI